MSEPPTEKPPSITEPVKWFGYHAGKDWPVLVKAPLGVLSILLLALILGWFLIWQVVVPLKNEQINTKQTTIDAYKARYGDLSGSPSDDISRLFVVETATNLIDGRKIILSFEPVPQTVRLTARAPDRSAPISSDETGFSVSGKTITITNQLLLNSVLSLLHDSPGWSLRVDYARRSIH